MTEICKIVVGSAVCYCSQGSFSNKAEAKLIQRILGALVILLGLSCAGLLGYTTFVNDSPRVREYSIFPPIIASLVLLAIGVWLLRSRVWLSWDKVFRPFFGVCAVVFGVIQLGCSVYGLIVGPPEGWEGVPLLPPFGMAFVMIAVGVAWLRRKPLGEPASDEAPPQVGAHFQRDTQMPIHFHCPSCQQSLQAAEDQAGTERRCPRCTAVVTVPPPQKVTVPTATSLETRIAASPSPAKEPSDV
jgi:phage FluMu protein Com